MIDFTDELLRLKPGTITYYAADLDSPVAGTWSIEIPLEPFSADDEYEPETFRPGQAGPELVETEFSLDFISLPTEHLTALSARTFTFPVNPEDGYIDGSIYLVGTHNPVDVTRIAFGETRGDEVRATLHAELVLGAPIRDRTANLETTLRYRQGRLATTT
ncbi:hypothetical protein [Actinomadura algeriensis]|uniref:Uncharacterized protein n=1 Tax=Actinomadura algeriensis TaxID=1679523 RepID=A0ABR9JLK6_9ACTN|nr:hypothetical protein [Actinomadura algeriensis]MBE1531256.1 hypothetical protein [Actinomadura algeriensis]